MNNRDREDFIDGYITALIWSSNTDGQKPEGYNITDDHDADDLTPEALGEIRSDCVDFIGQCADMLEARSEFTNYEYMGHDFALTRNGHGAGFWDRGLIYDEELTDACKPYGSMDLYVGDDGNLYV